MMWRTLVLCGATAMVVHAGTAPSAHAQSEDSTQTGTQIGSHATRNHFLVIGAGALGAATFNQATAMPAKWKRTWAGYGARVGDQVGFAVVEESLRAGLGAVMPWTAPAMECRGARASSGRGVWSRIGAATTCGIMNTLVVRNADGARRPNVPLLGAIVGASAVSLAWRPERADAAKGRSFVQTRISAVTGGAMGSAAYSAFKDRRP
ncbi:MAG: hypothetical protein IBJ03_09305 [Gemmatimonadaceae bacterium]|nr:hypothetical protein [Gemmatimonadaceae bacterium]